jgi:hypothetical protein
MTEKSLQPIEQKEVEMYGDAVTAVRLSDGHVYVSVRHMCQALGINRRPQVMRIQRQEVLADGYKGGIKLIPPSGKGGAQEMSVLRADLVPLWLTGIRVSAVDESIRDKLANLQRNAAKILWEAFQSGELTLEDDFQSLMTAASDDAVQAYLMVQAMYKLAKQQIVLEAQVNALSADHGRRLENLEAAIASSAAVVTQEEAMQISQAVKAVAIAQSEVSGRNEFGATYGELYRKFSVVSYKSVPRSKYQGVMNWLNEWYQTLTNEDLPF